MEKIKKTILNYFRKNSAFKIITDFLFYLLILSLFIPSTRTLILRLTLFSPAVKVAENTETVHLKDYEMILEDTSGNRLTLSDFSGRNVFISFWATWCPPCRAEMPSIQKLYDQYGRTIDFILVTSEEPSKVTSFLEEYKYTIPVYYQKSNGSGIFDVSSLPTSFLINSGGEVIVKKKGAANWNSKKFRKKIDRILKES